MRDLRKTNPVTVKGHFITAGYQVSEDSVKEMLQFMGVSYDDAMVQEAIGFFSSHSMEINMTNLYEFLKGKQVLSSVKDLRKKK